jgi:hypothetical protein
MSSKKILYYAHDPGGANAILSVVKALVARGDTLVDASAEPDCKPDLFLAGTSIGDTLDKRLLRDLTVPSVYVMDFWGNFKDRFPTLPTKICVIDEHSKEDALVAGIPADHVVVTGNPYFEHFADGITRDKEDKSLIVFISQPIRADIGDRYHFDEYQVLRDVIETLPAGCRLGIRLHPRDDTHKFDEYVNERVFITEGSLEETLSEAGCVVGMFSPVLLQAALAGKHVVRYQPVGEVGDELGLTSMRTTEELNTALKQFASGVDPAPHKGLVHIEPGATERIIKVIDELL